MRRHNKAPASGRDTCGGQRSYLQGNRERIPEHQSVRSSTNIRKGPNGWIVLSNGFGRLRRTIEQTCMTRRGRLLDTAYPTLKGGGKWR